MERINQSESTINEKLVNIRRVAKVVKGGRRIPYQIVAKYGGAQVLLKPAAPGTGLIAGGGVRTVLELAGITDILTKSQRSANKINVVRATILGLSQLKDPQQELAKRKPKVTEEASSG